MSWSWPWKEHYTHWQTLQIRTFLFSFLETWLLSIFQQTIPFNGQGALFLLMSETLFWVLFFLFWLIVIHRYWEPSSLVSQLISHQFIVKFIMSNYTLQIVFKNYIVEYCQWYGNIKRTIKHIITSWPNISLKAYLKLILNIKEKSYAQRCSFQS